MAAITIALEGQSDLPVVRRVFDMCGHEVVTTHGLHGKHYLDRNLHGYNNAARFAPWFVLRDLDHDADCPALLTARLLKAPASKMMLWICVRAVESWLLADPESLASFMGVSIKAISADPDNLPDPKGFLVNLARLSRYRAIRLDMAPRAGMSGRTGPAYVSRLGEFAENDWRPDEASNHSGSLRRCVRRLKMWKLA